MGNGRLSEGAGKVRQLVKGGVHAEEVSARERSADDLRKMMRAVVEVGIARLSKESEKTHLTGDDVDLLAKYLKLLTELERKIGDGEEDETDPSKMTDEQLARQIR